MVQVRCRIRLTDHGAKKEDGQDDDQHRTEEVDETADYVLRYNCREDSKPKVIRYPMQIQLI